MLLEKNDIRELDVRLAYAAGVLAVYHEDPALGLRILVNVVDVLVQVLALPIGLGAVVACKPFGREGLHLTDAGHYRSLSKVAPGSEWFGCSLFISLNFFSIINY